MTANTNVFRLAQSLHPQAYDELVSRHVFRGVYFAELPPHISYLIHDYRIKFLRHELEIIIGYHQSKEKDYALDVFLQKVNPEPGPLFTSCKTKYGTNVNDRDVALVMCFMNGMYISSISKELQQDKQIVLTACRNNYLAILCIPQWKQDEDVLRSVCSKELDRGIIIVLENLDLLESSYFSVEKTTNEIGEIRKGTEVFVSLK